MSGPLTIRLITPDDGAATLAIYAPYVQNTIISFEYEVPTPEEWAQRIATHTADYPWLVCAHGGRIAGYAYGSRHRYRTAYNWSAESTVYLPEDYQGRGIARILYGTLFELLRLQGHFNVYAGVGLPNAKSEAFHLAMGFEEIGVFQKIGYNLGHWHDTRWFQLHLAEHPPAPDFPKKLAEVSGTEAFAGILSGANERAGQLLF